MYLPAGQPVNIERIEPEFTNASSSHKRARKPQAQAGRTDLQDNRIVSEVISDAWIAKAKWATRLGELEIKQLRSLARIEGQD